MTIRILADDTIGKIAAGEVVDRPASVVKELLENALDAGSRSVAIVVEGGGIDRIEVSDDGCGISAEELPVAVQRHGTSKLTSFEDLDELTTLGFRGEALPSIGAVSSLSVRSRVAAEATGAVIRVDYGIVAGPTREAVKPGSTVVVEHLFANVPARRKFLRQPGTETATISRIVAAYACAYPNVRFSLTCDGRRSFATDGSGDLQGAAAGALGVEVGQAALALEPLEESAAVPGVEVRGWVTAPTVHRSHRQQMVFFVNGRMIQHRALSYALEEAFHTLLMVGRHPVTLVDIRIDPATVDVNVHPTKAEVKFLDERAVCRAVSRATHAALTGAPREELPRMSFRAPGPNGGSNQTTLALDRPTFANSGGPPAFEAPGSDRDDAGPAGWTAPILRVMGQVGGTYIIAEGPDGLYLIDQHAAHERVMYEKILAGMKAASVDRQPFLDPLVLDLPAQERAVLERSLGELDQIGFEIEPFGDGAVVIRAIPAMMAGVDIGERFGLILGELADGGAGDSWLDSVAISAACHTSIRAGQALSLAEMRELVAQLERTAHPRACGHGRPTMLLMSQNDLEKQFSRR
ncbi:MAG: DNA mismatch repair endonuclease MutL [Thermomicrobiales bacterium]